MREIPPGMLDEIVKRLVEALQPVEIYLFGSHAAGTPHRHSDLDFLVVVPDDAGDRHELAAQAYIAMAGLAAPIDIIVFHRGEIQRWRSVRFSLPHTALETGRLVYAI